MVLRCNNVVGQSRLCYVLCRENYRKLIVARNEADLEHQDWAAAQFPPEEEQAHISSNFNPFSPRTLSVKTTFAGRKFFPPIFLSGKRI